MLREEDETNEESELENMLFRVDRSFGIDEEEFQKIKNAKKESIRCDDSWADMYKPLQNYQSNVWNFFKPPILMSSTQQDQDSGSSFFEMGKKKDRHFTKPSLKSQKSFLKDKKWPQCRFGNSYIERNNQESKYIGHMSNFHGNLRIKKDLCTLTESLENNQLPRLSEIILVNENQQGCDGFNNLYIYNDILKKLYNSMMNCKNLESLSTRIEFAFSTFSYVQK